MKVLTLLTAMVLLVCATAAPHAAFNDILNIIFDDVVKLIQSSPLNYYVENLSYLSEGVNKCGDPFFCRVHDVVQHKLTEEEKKPKRNVEDKIVRELKQYIAHRKVNCTLALENVETSNITIQASQFWKTVSECIQIRNFQGNK